MADSTITLRPDRQGKSIVIEPSYKSGNEDLAQRFIAEMEQVEPILYYGSGHTVSRQGIVAEHFADTAFGGWKFESLENTDVRLEKPGDGTRPDIRRLGGQEDDRSLFGWIIRTLRSGWLYCDDGPDELCDFLHFDATAGRLLVWHVKACASGSRRSIAAVPYEQVCSQVTKNIPSLSPQRLVRELRKRSSKDRLGPLWYDGEPRSDVEPLIEAIQEPRANLEVVAKILQSHVTQPLLMKARESSEERLCGGLQRLRRLDHLLLSTAAAVGRVGARLEVVAPDS